MAQLTCYTTPMWFQLSNMWRKTLVNLAFLGQPIVALKIAKDAVCAVTFQRSRKAKALANVCANATDSLDTRIGASTMRICPSFKTQTSLFCTVTASECFTVGCNRLRLKDTLTSKTFSFRTKTDSCTRSLDWGAMRSACTKQFKMVLRKESALSKHLLQQISRSILSLQT